MGRLPGDARTMRQWDLIVTIVPGPRHVRDTLAQLRRLGQFTRSSFKDVCIGQVQDVSGFLESVRAARDGGERWAHLIARVIPVERTFTFTPESLTEQIKETVAPFVERMRSGTFHVRVERRGLARKIATQEIERAVADHLSSLAQAHGIQLETDFDAPDFVVAAETLGDQCGVALITREISTRYPFVQTR
jgi:tRNA(Ser,Leu) C12 N-acetylase TAN1